MRKLWKLLHASGVIVCLLLYFIGSVEVESVHGISHEHDRLALHTIEAEADPCHINTFHKERSGACEHKTHVSKNDRHENLIIGMVYEKAGETKKAKEFIDNYRQYLETDQTAYKDLGLSVYHEYIGDTEKAIEYLRRFSKQDNIQYWIILFMGQEPVPSSINRVPECKKLIKKIEEKFWVNHEKLKLTLEDKGLL